MNAKPQTQLSVIIVSFNSSHVIDVCLSALSTAEDVEVIVYDNASTDGSSMLIEERHPDVTLVRGDENLGFAGAVNRASTHASGTYLVFLNPDAIVTIAELRSLCMNLTSNLVGIAGPRIEHPNHRLKIMSAGKFPTAWRMFTHYGGLSRISGRLFKGHYLLLSKIQSGHVRTDWVTGACLAIRRDLFNSLGGLTECWFMYAEDIELCYRVRELQLEVVLDNTVIVQHAIGTSDASGSFSTNPAWILNLYEFYDLNICRSRAQYILWGAVVAAGLTSRSAVYRALSVRSSDSSEQWRVESVRFAGYARAVALRTVRPRSKAQSGVGAYNRDRPISNG